jgi:hypothetical protein
VKNPMHMPRTLLALSLAGALAPSTARADAFEVRAAKVQYADSQVSTAANVFLTGDGQEQHTIVASNADGRGAIEVHTAEDAGQGTHWKAMLLAHGHSAAFAGIDLGAYERLEFNARASRDVTLLGGFGTGDDSAQRGLPAMQLGTSYQKFSVDLSGLDLSDINTLLWVYLHKGPNDFDFSGVSVFISDITLVKRAASVDQFVTEDATFTLGDHVDEAGNLVHTEVLFDKSAGYVSVFPGSGTPPTDWVADRAIMHNQGGPLLLDTVELAGFYVQDCRTGTWVNIEETVYAPQGEPLSRQGSRFDVRHGYGNIVRKGLLDARFDCAFDPPQFTDVLLDGVRTTVPTAGRVHFAVVVEHRERQKH